MIYVEGALGIAGLKRKLNKSQINQGDKEVRNKHHHHTGVLKNRAFHGFFLEICTVEKSLFKNQVHEIC